jgi:hypothetical protein
MNNDYVVRSIRIRRNTDEDLYKKYRMFKLTNPQANWDVFIVHLMYPEIGKL